MKRNSTLAIAFAVAALAVLALSQPKPAAAGAISIVQLSVDPLANSSSQHHTQVEPDSFSYGSTVVAAVQTGRFFSGGAAGMAWATSSDGGESWTSGVLSGLTKYEGSGWYDRVSDPAVAYDAKHGVWLISSLVLSHRRSANGSTLYGSAVVVSRSTDGGFTWGGPVVTSGPGDLDKNWVVCDNWALSPYFGNCYVQYDDLNAGGLINMTTSHDGGLTWEEPLSPANGARGLGGQPVVQPDGTVVVPSADIFFTAIIAFRSTNGGESWDSSAQITSLDSHTVAGDVRDPPLPSAEVDANGKVYVVWSDCRFRATCESNDIVMSTSTDGVSWSPVERIPIDDVSSGVDHFIPGLGVDATTSGSSAHLALAYYYYPASTCDATTCQLNMGFVSSADGGATWSESVQLAGPMSLSWLPATSQGLMVGDYISVSFSGGLAHPVFVVAAEPGKQFDEAMYTVAHGLAVGTGPAAGTPTDRGTKGRRPSIAKRAPSRAPLSAR